MDISFNQLVGPIPDEIGMLTGLLQIRASHNFLTGGLPSTFMNLKSLQLVDFAYNNLDESISNILRPLRLLNIAIVNLASNQITGTFTTDILWAGPSVRN